MDIQGTSPSSANKCILGLCFDPLLLNTIYMVLRFNYSSSHVLNDLRLIILLCICYISVLQQANMKRVGASLQGTIG